jgi:aminopeptidase N
MKLLTALLASAALANAAPVLAQHQADTVDSTVPTQLPRTAIPHHYAITVTPHADKLTFDGSVAIDVDVLQPTNSLTVNAADLSISKATVSANGAAPLAATVTTDADAQTATVTFPRQLAPGAYRLAIDYSGKINTQANGLFALDYTNKEGKDARALFTQFEAADARRFVPSWDEPDYKATFDLTANIPANEMAVSNMPASGTKTLGNGMKAVTFRTTPTMSSYLLFFASGDLERISKPAAGAEV